MWTSCQLIIDYADSLSAWLLTACGHDNDYADIDVGNVLRLRTDGKLYSVKEQSGEMKYLGVFSYRYPIAIVNAKNTLSV